VINGKNPKEPKTVMDLGLSDHYAQVQTIPLKNFSNMPHRIQRTECRGDNVLEFLCPLNQATWQEVYVESDVNAKFNVFLYCKLQNLMFF
jgi:hypothetical protein